MLLNDAFSTRRTPEQAASQAIRDWCGWHVAPVRTETLTLDGNGMPSILLPSRQVHDITEVTVLGEPLDADTYEWSAEGMLRRRHGCWPRRFRAITVALEHGFADEGVLAQVMAGIVARVRMDPSGVANSLRAGTQAIGITGSPGGGLTASEKELLAPYRLTWGPTC